MNAAVFLNEELDTAQSVLKLSNIILYNLCTDQLLICYSMFIIFRYSCRKQSENMM